jgi:hypothetical protein
MEEKTAENGMVCCVHVMPSGDVTAVDVPTATNVPLPYATLRVLFCVDRDVHVMPSGDDIATPLALETKTYMPFP